MMTLMKFDHLVMIGIVRREIDAGNVPFGLRTDDRSPPIGNFFAKCKQ